MLELAVSSSHNSFLIFETFDSEYRPRLQRIVQRVCHENCLLLRHKYAQLRTFAPLERKRLNQNPTVSWGVRR
jgi:hypothetical protein